MRNDSPAWGHRAEGRQARTPRLFSFHPGCGCCSVSRVLAPGLLGVVAIPALRDWKLGGQECKVIHSQIKLNQFFFRVLCHEFFLMETANWGESQIQSRYNHKQCVFDIPNSQTFTSKLHITALTSILQHCHCLMLELMTRLQFPVSAFIL